MSPRSKEKSVLHLGLIGAFAVLCLVAACQPAANEERAKEVQGLKTDVAVLKEKVSKLEADLTKLAEQMKDLQKREMGGGAVMTPVIPLPPPSPTPAAGGAAPQAMSVEQLLKDKDRLVGTRVTVRGQPGPVMMHKKILYLQSAEGLIEVNFSQLTDKKQIERLTAQALETPVTVTGTVAMSPGVGKGPSRLMIMAETVEF